MNENENETKKRIRNCVFNDEWLKDRVYFLKGKIPTLLSLIIKHDR